MHEFALKARYVIPIEGPPIAGGVVAIRGERIAGVGKRSDLPAEDLGDVALLPGLVNAHTHLEFSDLAKPIGHEGMPLPDWLQMVIAARRDLGPRAEAIARGLDECAHSGTTTVGEIAQPEWPQEPWRRLPLDAAIFIELIGLGDDAEERLCACARDHCAAPAGTSARRHFGISPHAPYSIRLGTVERIAADPQAGRLIAMHLAESKAELELLEKGTGPFRTLLVDLGVWNPQAFQRAMSWSDFLRALSRAGRALIVHGNYFGPAELDVLAEHRETMSLVYCPRTHAFFRHAEYPLAAALERGINVALGTDSRASNPDLSLWEEARFLASRFPSLPPRTAIEMATVGGARALGRNSQVGSLLPGKLANLTAITIPDAGDGPYDALLQGDGNVAGTWLRGRRIY